MKETTLCKGTVTYTPDVKTQEVTCRFAELSQGSLCVACPWNKICSTLFAPTKMVTVVAFSGMKIGEFPVSGETETVIEVKTKDGSFMQFDKKTGIQLNPKDIKFANRIK